MNWVANDVPRCICTKAQFILLKIIKAYGASLYCDNQIQLSFVHEGLAKMNSFSVS